MILELRVNTLCESPGNGLSLDFTRGREKAPLGSFPSRDPGLTRQLMRMLDLKQALAIYQVHARAILEQFIPQTPIRTTPEGPDICKWFEKLPVSEPQTSTQYLYSTLSLRHSSIPQRNLDYTFSYSHADHSIYTILLVDSLHIATR